MNVTDTSIAHDFQVVMGNDHYSYLILQNACIESVRNDDAATNDVENAYRMAYRDNGDTWHTFVDCARLELRDAFLSMVDKQATAGMVKELLLQVLDIHNRELWNEITEGFMPDPDDVFLED